MSLLLLFNQGGAGPAPPPPPAPAADNTGGGIPWQALRTRWLRNDRDEDEKEAFAEQLKRQAQEQAKALTERLHRQQFRADMQRIERETASIRRQADQELAGVTDALRRMFAEEYRRALLQQFEAEQAQQAARQMQEEEELAAILLLMAL